MGGRLRGTAPAWYGVVRLGWAEGTQVGPARLGRAKLNRSQADLAAGVRAYFPFTPRLRMMTEVAFGQVFEAAEVDRLGIDPVRFDQDRFGIFLTGGLQYRLTNHISLGGHLGLVLMPSPEEPDLAARNAGIPESDASQGRYTVGLSTTFHF